jgi:hypothetical protein
MPAAGSGSRLTNIRVDEFTGRRLFVAPEAGVNLLSFKYILAKSIGGKNWQL